MARRLITQLEDNRLEPQSFQAADEDETVRLLESVDVCVNMLPPLSGYQMDIFKSCLVAGCNYIDHDGLGHITGQQMRFHEEFTKKGVAALIGFGSAPGITNLLAKYCSEQLDEVEKIGLYWTAKYTSPRKQIFVPPVDLLTVLAWYTQPSLQFIDGELKSLPALSFGKHIDLPEPFGRCEFVNMVNAETTTIPFSKGFIDKGIREAIYKACVPKSVDMSMKCFLEAVFGDEEPIEIEGMRIAPAQFLDEVIKRNMDRHSDILTTILRDVKMHEVYFTIAEGITNGSRIKIMAFCFLSPDRLYSGCYDPAAAISTSIGAQLLGRGEIPPGVWPSEAHVDTSTFFEELMKRHLQIRVIREEKW